METHECSNCKEIFPEIDMRSFNLGRKTQWICLECSKQGEKDAVYREMIRDTWKGKSMKK